MFESGSVWVSFSRATLKDALVIGLQDNWECFFFFHRNIRGGYPTEGVEKVA